MPRIADTSLMPLFAALEPDGSLTVDLLMSGEDDEEEPITATIPPIAQTRRLAIPGCRREISLDEPGDAANQQLAALVREFVERAATRRLEMMATSLQR